MGPSLDDFGKPASLLPLQVAPPNRPAPLFLPLQGFPPAPSLPLQMLPSAPFPFTPGFPSNSGFLPFQVPSFQPTFSCLPLGIEVSPHNVVLVYYSSPPVTFPINRQSVYILNERSGNFLLIYLICDSSVCTLPALSTLRVVLFLLRSALTAPLSSWLHPTPV